MMRRMEVPRLPLHNLQGGTGVPSAEANKPNKVAEVLEPQEPEFIMPENQSETSPPPSRILRSGKRVPTGTAVRAPPRTASKASRDAMTASDKETSAQAAPTPSAVATPASGAQQDHPSPMPANHSAGIKSLQGVESPTTFQALPTEMLPVASAAATSHTFPSPLPSGTGPELHSSPFLLDLQTSVSPMLISQPQPIVEDMVSMPGVTAPEVMSPVALAPSSTAQSEVPTPTLLPRGSTVGSMAGSTTKEAVSGSPPAASADVLAAESPRNILSSLQQMNLQSRPFDFDGNAQDGMSPSVPEQTPEPEVENSDSSQQGASGPTLEQTPEPIVHSTYEETAAEAGIDGSPGEPDSPRMQPEEDLPESTRHVEERSQKAEEEQREEDAEALPAGYISRRTTDPYMQKKLRGIQKEEWTAADGTFKLHKSKLELAKEEAAAARSNQLGSADKAAVRRLVTGAFQRVVATGGQSLGESMVKHKSRLEREKEVAEQQRQAEEAAQAQRAKRKVVHTPGSWTKQHTAMASDVADSNAVKGLGELGKHKSRLEKEKEAAAAARRATGASPPVSGKLPSYMRPTSASKAMQKGLGEDMTRPKSRLEREKEAAAAAAAAKPGSTSEVRKSSTSNVRSKVAEAWQGQPLESVLHKRKSKLEQDKENAAAAAASTSPKETQKPGAAARKSTGWGGQGLADLKVHKSKLQKDKDAWAKAAAAEEGSGKVGSIASRKPLLKESNTVSQKAVISDTKRLPSYMKSTHTSSTRSSIGSASDMDARFAF